MNDIELLQDCYDIKTYVTSQNKDTYLERNHSNQQVMNKKVKRLCTIMEGLIRLNLNKDIEYLNIKGFKYE